MDSTNLLNVKWKKLSDFPLSLDPAINSPHLKYVWHRFSEAMAMECGPKALESFRSGQTRITPIGENSIQLIFLGGHTIYTIGYKSTLLANMRVHFKEESPGIQCEQVISIVQNHPCSCHNCIVKSNFRLCPRCNKSISLDSFRNNGAVCNSCRSKTMRKRRSRTLSLKSENPIVTHDDDVKFDKEAYLLAINLILKGVSKKSLEEVVAVVLNVKNDYQSMKISLPILSKDNLKTEFPLSRTSVLRSCMRYCLGTISSTIINCILTPVYFGISSDQFQARQSKTKLLGVFLCGPSSVDPKTSVVNPFFSFAISGESGYDCGIGILSRIRCFCQYICTRISPKKVSELIISGQAIFSKMQPDFLPVELDEDIHDSEYLFALFLVHISAWIADSAKSEVKAAKEFHDMSSGVVQHVLCVKQTEIPHLPDPAHILRNSIQHAFQALSYLDLEKSEPKVTFSEHGEIPSNLISTKKTAHMVDFVDGDISDPEFIHLFKKQNNWNNLVTIPVNQVLSLEKEIRWPTTIGKPDISRQMSFDQNLLLFSYLKKHLQHYKRSCGKSESAASRKLLEFLNNDDFCTSMDCMTSFLSGISEYLSVTMDGRDLITLQSGLNELKTLFNSITDLRFEDVELLADILATKMAKIPGSSKRNLLGSSFGNLLVAYDLIPDIKNPFEAFFELFKLCVAISLVGYIRLLDEKLTRFPHLKSMTITTVPLEREFGYYKVLENPNELGATVTIKMIGNASKFSKNTCWANILPIDTRNHFFTSPTSLIDQWDANLSRK